MTALLSNSFAQYVCFDSTKAYNTRGGCTRVVPTDIYDTGLLSLSFIPNDSTPLITIPVNINVWRKDDGTGNYWQDTPAFRDSLRLAFEYLNIIYSQNQPYCLNIPNSQFIADTRVRFVIDTVFYYNNTEMALKTYPAPFVEYLLTHHPDRLNHFTYHLSIDTTAYWWGYSSGYNSDYPSVVSVRQHTYKSLYAFALHMAHEFGHNFGLGHPYDSEITTIAHPEFLWDVFGTATQSWCSAPPTKVCHHDAGWDCDPCTPYNTCTNNIMGGSYAARHFSALQCGRIQRALQVSSLRRFAYGEENPAELHINRNQLIDYTRKYYQTVIVDSGATLTVTCRVEMVSSARLIVRPGGKLVVDGGTLTSACPGEMWQGIEVLGDRTKRQLPQYQGTVELRNGATIENAHCGIRTGLQGDASYATTGGIIRAEDAYFINNRRSVEFLSYTNHALNGNVANNQSYFSGCSFTVDNDNLFSQNNGQFIDHVTLWDVKGIDFNGCAFENATTAQGDRRHAIYAEDAGFTVDKRCTDPVYNPSTCTCNAFVRSTFSGFAIAIEANTSGNQFPVKIDHSRFSENGTGVRINGNHFATVTRCDFDLTTNPQEWRYLYGLYLSGCSGFKVEANQFDGTVQYVDGITTGVYVKGSGSSVNSLYKNEFDNLSYGIHAYGNNSGLQIRCNEFGGNGADIFVPSGSSIASSQGSLQTSAGNKFMQAYGYNIFNGGAQTITYYYKNSTTNSYAEPVLNSSGVSVTPSNTANNCASTLCGITPLDPTPFQLAGFQSDMNAYTTALTGNNGDMDGGAGVETQNFASLPQGGTGNLSETAQSLSDTYYTAVRTLMSDSLLDLGTLEQWHAAAQPIADPYSLTETRFCEGYAETFAADVDDAEMANYAEFHAMKVALRNNVADDGGSVGANNYSPLQPGGHVNWYALTPAQIAQLQAIADRNTGRASVMAKGVLCFFFDICYDDEDQLAEDNGDVDGETRAKRTAVNVAADAALAVYPNPTDDLLHIELSGAEIANIALYDLQGRMVAGAHAGAPQQGTTATMNMRNVPAGVYLLRVTAADGKEYHRKIVKR